MGEWQNKFNSRPAWSSKCLMQNQSLTWKFHSRTTLAIGTTDVAQIYNLPYRRIAFGRPLQLREAGGLKIRDTAECNSALRPLQSASRCEISGLNGLPCVCPHFKWLPARSTRAVCAGQASNGCPRVCLPASAGRSWLHLIEASPTTRHWTRKYFRCHDGQSR